MRDDRERLRHILEAIERIERYVGRGRDAFEQDELIQTWMVRHLEIIGEAARAVSSAFRREHPEVPWASMVGMRHVLVHEYLGIDLGIVWQVVSADLPGLKRSVQGLLEEGDGHQ